MRMDFSRFFRDLRKQAVALARAEASDFARAAAADARALLDGSRADLRRWTQMLVDGEMSAADFEDLVRGLRSLARMEAVRQAGMAKIRAERLANALLGAIVDAGKALI